MGEMDIPDEIDPKENLPKVPPPWWHGEDGFFNAPWGPLMDENVMFPIAVYMTGRLVY